MGSDNQINLATTNSWLFASALFVIAFALGVWGFLETDELGLENFFYANYYTLQLIFIDPPDLFYKTNNWQLIIASVALPLFPAVAILKLITRVFGVQLRLWSLSFWSGHHVFLGAGKLSSSVIDAVNAQGDQKILAIDIDNEQMTCNYLRKNQGVKMLEHNVNEWQFLRALRLHKAHSVYVFTGDDNRNLEVAQKIVDILSKRGPGDRLERLVINIESTHLRDLFSESRDFKKLREKDIDVTWLSARRQAAQEIIGRYPPSNYPKKYLHVGLIGNGPLVKDVVGQLIKQTLLDYSGDEQNVKLDITLFSSDTEIYQEVLDEYPVLASDKSADEYGGLAPLAHIEHKLISSSGITPQKIQSLNTPLTAVYVLEGTDRGCVNGAFKAAQAYVSMLRKPSDKPRIIVGLLGDTYRTIADLHDALGDAHKQVFEDVSWFHRLRDSVDQSENYPCETMDLLGRAISDFYYKDYYVTPSDWEGDFPRGEWPTVGNCRCNGKPQSIKDKDLRNNWLQKSEAFRDSDRQAGYHALTKMRFLGFAMERRSVVDHLYSNLANLSHQFFNDMSKVLNRHECFSDKQSYLTARFDQRLQAIDTILETILIARPTDLSSQFKVLIKNQFEKFCDNNGFTPQHKSKFEKDLKSLIDDFFEGADRKQTRIKEAKEALEKKSLQLGKIEHRRFINERIIDGWLCDSYVKNDVLERNNKAPKSRKTYKLNHTLVDNETLVKMDKITGHDEKSKDDGVVRCLTEVLDDTELMERFIIYRLPSEQD